MSNQPENHNSDQQKRSEQNNYSIYGDNNISGNNQVSGDNNIIGNNNTVNNRISVNLPYQAGQSGSKVTGSGEPFQPSFLGVWFGFSIILGVLLISSPSGAGLNLISAVLFIYFASLVYSFMGWLLQSAFYYNWNFSKIRNDRFVWYFYPVLSVLGICVWFFWLASRFSYVFRGLFRF